MFSEFYSRCEKGACGQRGSQDEWGTMRFVTAGFSLLFPLYDRQTLADCLTVSSIPSILTDTQKMPKHGTKKRKSKITSVLLLSLSLSPPPSTLLKSVTCSQSSLPFYAKQSHLTPHNPPFKHSPPFRHPRHFGNNIQYNLFRSFFIFHC
jgi:hypothetical protein